MDNKIEETSPARENLISNPYESLIVEEALEEDVTAQDMDVK